MEAAKNDPAGVQPSGNQHLVVIDWRPYSRHSLQGFVDVLLPYFAIEIHGIAIHLSNGSRWASFPGRMTPRRFVSFLSFETFEKKREFTEILVVAVDHYIASLPRKRTLLDELSDEDLGL